MYGFVENAPVNDYDYFGLVDVKFMVTHDNFLTGSWFGLSWGWGQPFWAAEGDYSIHGNSASSFVKVYSGYKGNTCNTITPGHAGAINLFLRDCDPGEFSVIIQADIYLAGHGSAGQAHGTIMRDDFKILWRGDGATRSPLHFNGSLSFVASVGSSWTPVVSYQPTIAFLPGRYKPESSGASTAEIVFVSATRTGN